MERTKKMTASALVRELVVEELAPGQYLKECHETWNSLTDKDKWKLATILGFDVVLRIEMRNAAYTN